MKKLILIGLLIASSSACAKNYPPTYTADVKQKYILLDVINAIGILQVTAEEAVPKNIIPFDDARLIVKFTVFANLMISQTKVGWYATVQTAYAELKRDLPQKVLDDFGYAFTAFEAIFTSYLGNK